MENKTINKPMSVAREDFIQGITNHINNSGLPLFVVESILKDLLMEVTMVAKQQAEAERAQYEEMLKQQSAKDQAENK